MDCRPPGSSSMGFPRHNTGVGCHFLLQGVLPTHSSNLHLLHWQVDSLPLSHQGNSYTLFSEVLISVSLINSLFLAFQHWRACELFVCPVQSLSHVWLFATPWTAACEASLSFTIFRSLLKPMSIELMMPSNHLMLCCPFSFCLQSFPGSGSFPMSPLFASGGQSTVVSASTSVLPVNWEF